MDDEILAPLEQAIGYRFADRAVLVAALTHASFCNETRDAADHNERLEFLGDAIVNTITAALAFRIFPDAREGELTRVKAAVVSEPALAGFARRFDLGETLRMGKGAARGDKVGTMPSVLADAFEALVGAIYVDGGFPAAEGFLWPLVEPALTEARRLGGVDAKSVLQVTCLKRAHAAPRYEVVRCLGPSHDPHFEVRVTLPDGRVFDGAGRSKKDAEQAAAAEAIRTFVDPAEG
jgi:ribonuclease-3